VNGIGVGSFGGVPVVAWGHVPWTHGRSIGCLPLVDEFAERSTAASVLPRCRRGPRRSLAPSTIRHGSGIGACPVRPSLRKACPADSARRKRAAPSAGGESGCPSSQVPKARGRLFPSCSRGWSKYADASRPGGATSGGDSRVLGHIAIGFDAP
jgi:hypothetical protein